MGFAGPDEVVDSICGPCPRQPGHAGSMDQVRRMFDGYDVGIHHADDHIGRLLNQLADAGVLDETAIIISADHGKIWESSTTTATTAPPTNARCTCR